MAQDAEARTALVEAEEAERAAEFERRQQEGDRRREREYRAAIRRGGADAANARWDRASHELYETESRFDLCQWQDEGPGGEFLGRTCYRRTTDVYCHVHNRRLERESRRKKRERAGVAETAAASPKGPSVTMADQAPAPKRRRFRADSTGSGWTAYKARRPDRASRYASSAWQRRARAQLKANPACVVCGRPAAAADHVLAVGLGGDFDGPLQSLCREHHKAKTLAESHEAAKRAAQQRMNPR